VVYFSFFDGNRYQNLRAFDSSAGSFRIVCKTRQNGFDRDAVFNRRIAFAPNIKSRRFETDDSRRDFVDRDFGRRFARRLANRVTSGH